MPHRGAAWTGIEAFVRGRESLPHFVSASSPGMYVQQDEGLLHDVRNLVSAVGLYCDLLSMPHVLRPEHRHYADQLRLLGERSASLIERLIDEGARPDQELPRQSSSLQERRAVEPIPVPGEQPRFEGLRAMVERCTGLLHCVAPGHSIEISYGDAAALSVRVAAEAVERILVNLVRNAAAAFAGCQGCIRIGVGLLPGIIGEIRPWPFQRVCLTVEDDGCGMSAEQVEELLRGELRQHRHGIGFQVVRELTASSGGELTVTSQQGYGTRVEIAWPVATQVADDHVPAALQRSAGDRGRAQW